MNAAAQLDSRDFVTRLDPKNMLGLTESFPDQVRRAVDIANAAPLATGSVRPDLVMLTGLGGSAAGGDFVRALFEANGSVPFFVNRDYHLPAFVGSGALVIACSYSGNTEETLSAYHDARRKGASIICVTSGGKLAELAESDGFPLIRIPAGQPPRTALGFLLMPVVVASERLGMIPAQDYDALIGHLEACVKLWTVDVAGPSNPCKSLALALHGKVAVLYGLGSWQGLVANRWKGQINENAKVMAFANTYPELNHNEILGWVKCTQQGVAQWAGVVLQDGSETAKMRKRREVTERLTADVCEWHGVTATGQDLLQKALALALFGDFLSLYMAALNGVDPENIDSINILKNELASVN